MEAIILAGGAGTRLRSRVADLPKPMAPILGRPFLEYVLDGLGREGVSRVVLSVGHLGDRIKQHFGSSYGQITLVYSSEDTPLGTGGAIKQAVGVLSDGAFLVLNGDTLVPFDVGAMQLAANQRGVDLVITVCHVSEVGRFGAVVAHQGLVSAIEEKGRTGHGLINAGVYMLGPEVVRAMDSLPVAFSFEKDVLEPWIRKHRAGCVWSEGPFLDIGIPDSYDAAADVISQIRLH